jgi:hypothetical protein
VHSLNRLDPGSAEGDDGKLVGHMPFTLRHRWHHQRSKALARVGPVHRPDLKEESAPSALTCCLIGTSRRPDRFAQNDARSSMHETPTSDSGDGCLSICCPQVAKRFTVREVVPPRQPAFDAIVMISGLELESGCLSQSPYCSTTARPALAMKAFSLSYVRNRNVLLLV